MAHFRKYFSDTQLEELAASDPNWGVNVHTVGHYLHAEEKPYPDPRHPLSHAFKWATGRRLGEFQIVFIASGEGVYENRHTGRLRVPQGTIMLHFPGVWHRYKPNKETGWEEYWVGFDGHYADYLMQQECFDLQPPLIHIGFHLEFVDVFNRLLETVRHEGVAYRQIASCLVIQLLGLVYASALNKRKKLAQQEQRIQTIRLEVHKRWDQSINFSQLAQAHNVSYEWFRKAFKNVTGSSPNQYHQQLKMERAQQMLRETAMTISEIAFRIGFADEFHFSRLFKKKVGCSPSEYRVRSQNDFA